MAWRQFLVFDLDGTLIDSAPDIADAVNVLLGELNRPPLALDAVKPMIGDGAPVLLARALKASAIELDAAELMPRFKVHYEAASTNRTALYPKVRETLEAFRREGRHLALCTNKPSAATMMVLDHFDLSPLFHAVIGGDSMKERKPAKEPLLAAIARAGGDAARAAEIAVMIGDSHTDLATAKAGDVPAVIIHSGYGRPADRVTQGAYHEIARFADLPALLGELDQN
ncbi:phosphoglycolate phosphatase [Dongia sp.]|uniref:phosphoglycolate phosphatase n=1 Tax=Dongia sp. TaxID=1977262 RepID=UPI0035AD99FB